MRKAKKKNESQYRSLSVIIYEALHKPEAAYTIYY